MTGLERRETDVVIDPRNGTVLDPAAIEHEPLVDVLLALRQRLDQLKQWEQIVNDELVRRHGNRRAPQPVGAYEVDVRATRGREWDAEGLEHVLAELVARDLLGEHEIEGIVIAKRVVDGKKAAALLSDLDGEALTMVRDCFMWKKARPKAEVTPAVSLEP